MVPIPQPIALIPGWLPPSRENWELLVYYFQFFPLFTAFQWFNPFWPQGKTSIDSRLNLPGKWAWCVMESPAILLMGYSMYAIPRNENLPSLPWGNWTMAALYILHYIYRALLSPLLLNPSMSPIHPIVFFSAIAFNTINALSIGGWCAGYGPTTLSDWAGRLYYIEIGMVLWAWSLMGNIFHDDDLREIRRAALRRQREANAKQKSLGKAPNVDKLYMMPKNGLFQYILFPHYLCEWCEWAAFWMIGGWGCVPARNFLLNEISTMTPRALTGYQWYVDRFGKEKVGRRKAVIPGLL